MSVEQIIAVEKLLLSGPDLSQATIDEMRTGFDQLGMITPPVDDFAVETVVARGVNVERGATPTSDRSRAIVYLHGGGYMVGSVNSHRGLVSLLNRASGAQTLAVAYRLAPEHPYPAAVDDSLAVYEWLLETTSPGSIAFVGDSAGGGLAVATLVAARSRGLPTPSSLALLSPFVDLTCSGASINDNAARDILIKEEMLAGLGGTYLAGGDIATPLASPLFADLAGLPPTIIHCSGSEALLDDSVRLARKLAMAGAAVEVKIWPGLPHVWQMFSGILDEGKQSLTEVGSFLKSHFR
ncbi:UNVERIFIED_ORG: acetyl esterase/lipase [Xanthobacter viscosus]|uniref:Alpha/beta hydrolase n=1 Tax=Xanthobacter autotrophicus TaxID=280 RepID=A0A6C1KDR5_XANAU|nr:alpha/beta hydrolase [Xanthobacter autotrophicus]TLX41384.1 alpha/beta hydrolase [Xanthobacter autotrophicus]